MKERSQEQPLIDWKHLNTLPYDARLVLHLRKNVRRYTAEHKLNGSVADLIAEQELFDTNYIFRCFHNRVRQPITFSLPTPVLKFLSRL